MTNNFAIKNGSDNPGRNIQNQNRQQSLRKRNIRFTKANVFQLLVKFHCFTLVAMKAEFCENFDMFQKLVQY